MGKKKRKKKGAKATTGRSKKKLPNLSRIGKIVVGSGIVGVIAVIANLTTILNYFGLSPVNYENPTTPSYVLYETPPDLTRSSALYNQGLEAYSQNNYDVALERFDEALKEYERISHADVDTAKIQYATGMVYKRKGNLDMAIQWYSDAIGTVESLPDAENYSNELGYIYYLRGFAYLNNRNLPRALADCGKCFEISTESTGSPYPSSKFAPLYLCGSIYTASYYGTHSPYPVHGGTDLGVSWFDAMSCFESALQYRGAQLSRNMDDSVSDDVITVKAYSDYVSLILQILQLLRFNGKPVVSETLEPCYIIHEWDVETAVVLTQRAALLSMNNTDDSLSAAIENCNAALCIYDSLPIDEREGIQNTYRLLAITILTQEAMAHDGHPDAKTLEACRELMEQSLIYTTIWYGESYATAVAYENMGFILMIASQYGDATENFEEAKRIFAGLGLEKDAEKQNRFLEIVAKITENGGTGIWETYLTDDFSNLILKY